MTNTIPDPTLGCVFPVLDLPTQEEDVKQMGATKAKRSAANLEQLAQAVESHNLQAVEALLANKVKLPPKMRGQKTYIWFMSHFTPAMAALFDAQSFPFPRMSSHVLSSIPKEAATPKALEWFLDQAQRAGLKMEDDVLRLGVSKFLDDNNLDAVQTLVERHGKEIAPYCLGQAFDKALEQQHQHLAVAILSSAAMREPSTLDKQHAKARGLPPPKPSHPLGHWISYVNLSYPACVFLQDLLPFLPVQAKNHWQALFPQELKKDQHVIKDQAATRITLDCPPTPLPDLLHVLVSRGNAAVATLVTTPQGASQVAKVLTKPNCLRSFLRLATTNTASAVRAAVAPHMAQWTDHNGNTWSHYVVAGIRYHTKHLCDELYSQDPADLNRPNNLGFTAADCINDPKAKVYLSQKLIKKELNTNKTGLVHNRTKKANRKM